MPAISYQIATTSSDTTTTGTSYTAITGASVTLTAGRWLILCNCAFRHEEGTGGAEGAAEVEARHNSTRIAVGRWGTAFGSFNTGDAAAGGLLQFHAVIDASASDTVSLYLRRQDGTASTTVRAGHATIIAISLDNLVEGTDYWFADSGSGDTAETSITGTTFVEGDADGQLEVTIPDDGDYLWISSCEGFIGSISASPTVGYQARWRIDGSDSGIEVTQSITNSETSPFVWPNYCVIDVRTYTASDTPRAEWEFANLETGTLNQFRRTRTFLLRLSSLRDYEFITNGGNIQASGGSDVEAANGVSYNFGSTNALILGAAAAEPGGSDWGDAALHRDAGDIDYPDGGYLQATWVSGNIGGFFFLHALAVTGSETFRLVQRTDPSATTYTLGRNAANNASARTPLIALDLYVPDPSGDFGGSCTNTVDFAADFSAVAIVSASCSETASFAASFTATAGISASCLETSDFAADFTGTGAVNATFSETATFSATFTGTSTVQAALSQSATFAATFAGEGLVSSDLLETSTFAATFSGSAAVVAACDAQSELSATFSGVAAIVSTCENTASFEATFSNGSTSTSELFVGGLTESATFQATFTGIGAFAGALSVNSSFRWATSSPISGKTLMRVRTNTRTLVTRQNTRRMRVRND